MKTCSNCSRTYSRASWLALRLVGIQDGDDSPDLELRQCVCGTTLAVAITDDDEDVFAPLRRAVGG